MSCVLVIAEHRQGSLRPCTLEALGAARGLQADVVTALLADAPGQLPAALQRRTPRLRLVAHPLLADYDPETYLPPLAELIAELAPRLILLPHTSQGMDLAPALAGRARLPLVTDCTALADDGAALRVQRRICAGKVIEELSLKPAPAIVATVQVGAFGAAADDIETATEERTPETIAPRHACRILGTLAATTEDVDIAAAEVLVSVGRGIGSKENVALAEQLAAALGATLSCSRPVADAGWLPKSRQVGTSGKTVRPKIYLALGISGAFQHLAGMKDAGTIIAVNRDPAAPIFQAAHYGVVADVLEVLPQLLKELGR